MVDFVGLCLEFTADNLRRLGRALEGLNPSLRPQGWPLDIERVISESWKNLDQKQTSARA